MFERPTPNHVKFRGEWNLWKKMIAPTISRLIGIPIAAKITYPAKR